MATVVPLHQTPRWAKHPQAAADPAAQPGKPYAQAPDARRGKENDDRRASGRRSSGPPRRLADHDGLPPRACGSELIAPRWARIDLKARSTSGDSKAVRPPPTLCGVRSSGHCARGSAKFRAHPTPALPSSGGIEPLYRGGRVSDSDLCPVKDLLSKKTCKREV
jgi:hypothetical protein